MIKLAALKDQILAKISAMTPAEVQTHFENAGCDVVVTQKSPTIKVRYVDLDWVPAPSLDFRDEASFPIFAKAGSFGFMTQVILLDSDFQSSAAFIEFDLAEKAANSSTMALAA